MMEQKSQIHTYVFELLLSPVFQLYLRKFKKLAGFNKKWQVLKADKVK